MLAGKGIHEVAPDQHMHADEDERYPEESESAPCLTGVIGPEERKAQPEDGKKGLHDIGCLKVNARTRAPRPDEVFLRK